VRGQHFAQHGGHAAVSSDARLALDPVQGGDDTVERQDATLALIAVCLARGLLLWEDVEAAVKSHLHNVERLLDERKTVLFSRLLLNFVELLLTNRRTGAGRMMLDTDWARLRTLRATQPTLSDVYLMLKYLVQLSGPWKGPATACIQQVVQDSGFGPITACDDPRAFLKECCNPCLLILKTQEESVVPPFRTFSFAPETRPPPPSSVPNGPQRDRMVALGALRSVMKRVGQWSVHYDTVEIRILVDSWKGVLLSAEDGEAATDGWLMMTSSPRVDKSWVVGFEGGTGGDALSALRDSLRRKEDQGMEHEVVHYLLAWLWRAPQQTAQFLDFAKWMGTCFADKAGMNSGCWFEEQVAGVLLAALACDPVARACIGPHEVFANLLHPSLPDLDTTGDGNDKGAAAWEAHGAREPFEKGLGDGNGKGAAAWEALGAREPFEKGLVHLAASLGVPPAGAPRETAVNEAMVKLRVNFTQQVVAMVRSLVLQAAAGDMTPSGTPVEVGEGGIPTRPTLEMLQRAVILRLQMVGAGMSVLPDNKEVVTPLAQAVMDCVEAVFGSEVLLGSGLGESVYQEALSFLDRVGCTKSPEGFPNWFRNEAQMKVLHARLPRFVAWHAGADLPVRNVWESSFGPVRATVWAPAPGANGEVPPPMVELPAVRTFDECFDVDPWFQLEDGTSGAMLPTYMEPQRKRQRQRLRFEYASSETIAAEKAAAELRSQEAAQQAAAALEPPIVPQQEEMMQEETFEVGGAPMAPMSMEGSDWNAGWNSMDDGTGFLCDLDLAQ